MDMFQRQTAAFFTRLWIENAVDSGSLEEALLMSRRLDELTVRCLLDAGGQGSVTATGGRA